MTTQNKYIPTTTNGEDNAAKAFHIFVVTYFGGDYDRALDFIIGLMVYRNNSAIKARDSNATT